MDDRKYLEGEVVACAGSVLEDMSDGESFDAALEEQIRLRAELPAPAVYVPRDQVGQLVREEIAMALSRVGRRPSDRPERDLQELAKDEREWILESAILDLLGPDLPIGAGSPLASCFRPSSTWGFSPR